MKKKQKKTRELYRQGQKWTQQEMDLLKKLYPTTFNHELEKYFGRRGRNIGIKAGQMGLKKNGLKHGSHPYPNKQWSKEEIKRLKNLYPVMPTPQLLKRFPKRSRGAIQAQATILGLRKNYLAKLWLWSVEDIETLRRLWTEGHTASQIAEIMGRTLNGTRSQLQKQRDERTLENKYKSWSKSEDKYLIRHYNEKSLKEIMAALGRTKGMIQGRTAYLKIRKSNHWSSGEIEKLRQLWEDGQTVSQIVEILKKNKQTVTYQLKRQKYWGQQAHEVWYWTKEEDDFIVRHYHEQPAKQIAVTLGRTTSAIRARAIFLKIPKLTSWTNEDIGFLKKYYQTLSCEQIAQKLGNRTLMAVKGKAAKLGLRKTS